MIHCSRVLDAWRMMEAIQWKSQRATAGDLGLNSCSNRFTCKLLLRLAEPPRDSQEECVCVAGAVHVVWSDRRDVRPPTVLSATEKWTQRTAAVADLQHATAIHRRVQLATNRRTCPADSSCCHTHYERSDNIRYWTRGDQHVRGTPSRTILDNWPPCARKCWPLIKCTQQKKWFSHQISKASSMCFIWCNYHFSFTLNCVFHFE